MPTLNFPGNPTLNDIYTFNGRSWQWNGTAWQQLNAGSINGLPIGNSNPSTGAFTTLTAVGNVSGNYFIGNGAFLTGVATSGEIANISNGTSNVTIAASGGNISVGVAGTAVLSFTAGGIINDQANGVGNIGDATGYFDTVFAKSTSAQYADLAEMYSADRFYEPGTVVRFGGEHDVTLCADADDTRVAGVISTNPSYVMNAVCSSEFAAAVALVGKVPTQVLGPVAKGDMMVPAGAGRARACNQPRLGTVIGKSLEDFSDAHGVINIVVGRL